MALVNMGTPGVGDLPPGTHLCALYSGSVERDSILFAFLREGLRRGDTCKCYVDGLEPDDVRARAVAEAAVADPPADQFDVRPASEVYLQSGRFSIQHMTSVLSDSVDQIVAGGSGMLRITGEMPRPGVVLQPQGADDFFVYEAAIDEVVEQKQAIFMCLYDVNRLGVDMLVAVLKTHPVVLLDKTVIDNPHFATHAEYAGDVADPDRPLVGGVPVVRGPDLWPSLTRSELGVARLVAEGLINKDIAQRLSVSPHTVDAHLKHIYAKLGIHSRVELTVLAMHRVPAH